jgi:drug/metabolite transporter (DMT)-like permease
MVMSLAVKSPNPRTPLGPVASDRPRASAAGTAAGISASLVWGSAFLVPVLLGGWNPVIVTLGRYLVYGLLSAILFTLGGCGPRRVLREHWRTALAFALAGNAAYYLLLVIGIRAAGAPLTDMVIGAIPVVLAVTGNVLAPARATVPWRRLTLPLTLVTAGLALISALQIAGVHAYLATSPAEKALGLMAACAAVAMWTWYALANARFLARQRAVSPAGWSTAVGVATGAVALAGLPAAALTGQLATPSVAHAGPATLVAGVVFLGIVVTWVGTWLWNLASSRLSAAVAGLLINLETVSGFGYVYAARLHWPAAGQLAGLALVMAGVTLTLTLTSAARAVPAYVPPDLLRSGLCSTAGPPRRRASTNC